VTPADREMPSTGGPLDDRAAVAIVGQNLPDVAREALKIARFEARSRPVLLVDLLGQGSALNEMFADEDLHGVSDAARYGVSLARVARPVPDVNSLFVVPGGTETPLADDVLSDHLWGSWSDQCRRSGALLVVAAPADLPAVGKAIDQLDGLVMIGDAAVPDTHVPVIGRVGVSRRVIREEAAADADAPVETGPVDAAAPASARRLLLWTVAALGAAALLGGVWWANGRMQRSSVPTGNPVASQPIAMPGDPVTIAAASGAVVGTEVAVPWSVEIASVNTFTGAMARVRQALDSLPVPTFAASHPAGGYATWYRLLAGAFTSSEKADSLLVALRARGAIEPAAGRVVQTPLAWLLDEGVLDEQLSARLFGWRQQGLPAYALVDRNGMTRIYFGAFENEAEARLFTPMLDSLNLYATLVTRIGSIR
jgi:cell division septation protein DedD